MTHKVLSTSMEKKHNSSIYQSQQMNKIAMFKVKCFRSCSQWQFSGWGWILETPEEHPCWRYTEGKRFALICRQSRCGSGRGWSSFFIRNNSPPSQTEFSQIRKQCHSLGMSISQQCSDNASYWWMLGHETRAKTLGIRVNSQWTAPTFMLFPCGLDWESERNSDYYR